MISALTQALTPLFLPLLKLELKAPHLPEGVTLVRHLKPAPAWLGLRYAGVLFGLSMQLLALGGATFGLLVTGKPEGALAAGLGALVMLGVVCFSLVTTRIDFELRHYLVGDRSLRVSAGAVVRREVTLSYANVQNIEVLQGPLERLFGIKSVTVSTAGGGGAAAAASTHQVVLAGITDADAVRELILGMVKQQRDTGLGEAQHAQQHGGGGFDPTLLAEVRDAALAVKLAVQSRAP
ncbi:MAG: PH domain-containing protein [Archangiaceae bacterium]|nr:PH domain-containing protein [Archangiaceae bacterium]